MYGRTLGFAELIGGTAAEARVQQDAAMIVREAMKMRQTVESVLEFWRTPERGEGLVNVLQLARELEAACAEKLRNRGVRLVMQGPEEEMLVRGDRHRLRQMLEHLLNNAAQALAGTGAGTGAGEERAIRVSVGGGAERVHVLVSDTGPGFREPGRVFDPFRAGAGLGLSLCYGIAHEHGGEIRAFNLQPHGAAVAVELPAMRVAAKKDLAAVGAMVA